MIAVLPILLLLGAQARVPSADDLFLQARYAEAAEAFEGMPELRTSAGALNRLGISYHLLGRFKEAEDAYKRAIDADSDLPVPRNNLGALYYSQREFGDADREFRRAADRNADSDIVTTNLHASRYARDNRNEARKLADEAFAGRPLLLQPFDGNEGDFLAIVSLLPEQTRKAAADHELKGDIFTARKMFEDAVIEYKRSIALDKYNATVINRLGIAYHHLAKIRDAERQYREALRLRPNYIDAMNNLAVIDYIREDYLRALSRYSDALKLQPESATILRNMGACLFALQRWEDGTRAFLLALSIDPELFDPQPGGAGTAIQMNNKNSAMQYFYLAKVFATAGNAERAISFLHNAVDLGFDDLRMVRDEEAFKALRDNERFAFVLQRLGDQRAGLD